MFCRNCGKQLDEKAAVCTDCGVKVGTGNKFCNNCGKATDEKAYVCVSCGIKLSQDSESGKTKIVYITPDGKRQINWIVAMIISFFFGYLGVDRFMMGQVGIGILKLVTCGGCGVWSLVDFILIVTKYKFKDVEWVE